MSILGRRFHMNVSGREPTLAHLLDFQLDRQPQRDDPLPDRLGVDASVDQSAERHVAADAAETVEMGYAHWRALLHRWILPRGKEKTQIKSGLAMSQSWRSRLWLKN